METSHISASSPHLYQTSHSHLILSWHKLYSSWEYFTAFSKLPAPPYILNTYHRAFLSYTFSKSMQVHKTHTCTLGTLPFSFVQRHNTFTHPLFRNFSLTKALIKHTHQPNTPSQFYLHFIAHFTHRNSSSIPYYWYNCLPLIIHIQ